MADIVNGRCHNDKASQNSPPLFQHGKLVIQMHHIGWLVSGVFTIAATVISFWLMNKHLQWYTNKSEQRYIIRILLMVPLYAVISTASYLFWNHSTPLLLVRDCYESIVLTSFFYLLLLYLSLDPDEQKEIFRKYGLSHYNDRLRFTNGESPRKWMFPLGRIKARPQDGLYFLQMMKWGVLQYCVIRPTTTLAAMILDYAGLYCEDSWSPGWGHLYISVIVSISVSISMYCLIQLYVCVSSFLAPQKPLLKMFAIKAVVFLTFWQATFLSLLATFGFIKDTQYMTAENINIGIGAIAETVEMTLFALLHIKAFSYKPYGTLSQRTKRLRALFHAFNFMETYRELRSGTIYLWHRVRGHETDVMARRQAVLEGVFGRSRIEIQGGPFIAPSTEKKHKYKGDTNAMTVEVAVEQTVQADREYQWLGVSDEYGSGLHWPKESHDANTEYETGANEALGRPGYHLSDAKQKDVAHDLFNVPLLREDNLETQHRAERPWRRNTYNRLSQTNRLSNSEPASTATRQNRSHDPFTRRLAGIDLSSQTYDDPPPASSIKKYRETKSNTVHSPPSSADLHSSRLVTASRLPGKNDRPQFIELHSATPMQFETSLASVSDRTDSVLGRVFPPNSNVSHSTEALSGATSSQSHRTQVQLTSGPEMLTSPSEHRSIKRKPVRYYPPDAPLALPMTARIEEEEEFSILRLEGQTDRERSSSPFKAVGRAEQSRDVDTVPVRAAGELRLPKRHIPQRDQIVLPAPLAPVSTSPSALSFSSTSHPGSTSHSHSIVQKRDGPNELDLHMPFNHLSQPHPAVTQLSPFSNNEYRNHHHESDGLNGKERRRSKRIDLKHNSHSYTFLRHSPADFHPNRRVPISVSDADAGRPRRDLRGLPQLPIVFPPAPS